MPLNQSEYFQEKLSGLTLSDEIISGISFEECDFSQCNIISCQILNCRFLNCTFGNCMLSAINPMGSRFIDATFTKSKVLSVDWAIAQEVRGLKFTHCQIDYSNFRMLKLPKLIMTDCIAKGVSFEDVDLSDGDFQNTDFEESVFFKANLSKANFIGAKNYLIDPTTNKLKKTRFSYPEVMSLLNSLDIVIE